MQRAESRAASAAWLLVGCAFLGGCATGSSWNSRPSNELESSDGLERADAPALLLLMTDQLLFEPFAVREIFRNHPEFHERLALTLGRVGDPRALPYLESLLADPVVEVRRAAAFALGQLDELRAYPHLLGALGDRDREVGRLSAESLARLGLPLETVRSALGVVPEEEALERVLPALFRFEPDEIHGLESEFAQTGVAAEPPLSRQLERWLLYALARSGDARGLPRLRSALDDQDPWTRGWAVRGLGRLGDRSDLEPLRRLLADPEAGVLVQVLRAARTLIDTGKAAPPESWSEDLERLLEDPRSGVRLSAIEASGSWIPSSTLAQHLRELASLDRGRAAELALVSLARAGDLDAGQLAVRAESSSWPSMRRAAAVAAAELELDSVLDRLRRDPEPIVRVAAVTVALEESEVISSELGQPSSRTAAVARESLLDPDPGVRTVALEWLGSNPVAPLDELVLALSGSGQARLPDLEVAGTSALAARALIQPLERGASVAALERLAENADYVVRRAAGEALVELDRERPPLGTVGSRRTLRDYRSMIDSLRANRGMELVTQRGRIVVALEVERAPLTSINFIQLAQAGFFDGLVFHRVIADFVAQGGDPRGDGWGGPGFSIRDEHNRIPFERGVVGMAKSGAHTAGSQFFLTLSSQPHLDGSYTAFGRLVSGHEVLDSIEQGDVIVSLRAIGSPDR